MAIQTTTAPLKILVATNVISIRVMSGNLSNVSRCSRPNDYPRHRDRSRRALERDDVESDEHGYRGRRTHQCVDSGDRCYNPPWSKPVTSCRCSRGPKGTDPMTDAQFVAFVLAPLMAVAVGWGDAYWARHAA